MTMALIDKPEGSGRRPLDVFDSAADGLAAYILEETVQAARDVIRALERFDEALRGCATPLNMWKLAASVRVARQKAEAWVETLAEAREFIELDLLISDTIDWSDIEGWDPAEENLGRVAASPKR